MQDVRSKHKQNWINHLEKWTTPDLRNTPSTTNLEEEEIVDSLGNDGNASMPEQVDRPNPWRKMTMMKLSGYKTGQDSLSRWGRDFSYPSISAPRPTEYPM
jgi:hypothetical protein